MTPRPSGHYWAACGKPVHSPTEKNKKNKKNKKTNTRGREDTRSDRLGPRNYFFTTCFIRFFLARVFFVPLPPTPPPPLPSLKYLCSLKISLPASFEGDYLKKTGFSFVLYLVWFSLCPELF